MDSDGIPETIGKNLEKFILKTKIKKNYQACKELVTQT